MAIGAGALDFGAYLRGNQDLLRAGLDLDYQHRVSRGVSLFGQGWGGVRHEFGAGTELDYGAMAGLRMRW